MRVLIMLVAYGVGIVGAAAQAPVGIVSSVESGWTSNASESEGGAADFYLRHSHDVSATGTMGPLSLRTGLMLEQQVFRQFTGENDLSVTGGVEAGLALGDGVALRLGYALTQEWTGKMLDLGPLVLTITSPAREHEALAELVVTGSGRAVTLGVDARWRQPGLTEFAGLPLEPAIIEADVSQVTARVDGEWIMTPELAGLARLHWLSAGVAEADQVDFGREPAGVARLAGGLRLRQGVLTADLHAGFDLVWPQDATDLLRRMPYLDARVEWAAHERLVLSARLAAGAEIFKPIDDVASHKMDGDLGMRLALSDRLAMSLGVGMSREQGLYDEGLFNERRSVRGGFSFALSPHLDAGLTASHAEISEPGAHYPVSIIALMLGGRV